MEIEKFKLQMREQLRRDCSKNRKKKKKKKKALAAVARGFSFLWKRERGVKKYVTRAGREP